MNKNYKYIKYFYYKTHNSNKIIAFTANMALGLYPKKG